MITVGKKALIVGLHGDPVSKEDGSPSLNEVTVGNYSFYLQGTDARDRNLFWSRVLLCRLIGETNLVQDSLVLVLKPRSCWLYKKDATTMVDYSGDETNANDPSDLSESGTNNIQLIQPAYKVGEIIQIGQLSLPINIRTWTDENSSRLSGYTMAFDETYYTASGGFTNIRIWGQYHGLADMYPSSIYYFDMNVDGRKRSNTGTIDGDSIIIPVCKGGVVTNYRLIGEEVP